MSVIGRSTLDSWLESTAAFATRSAALGRGPLIQVTMDQARDNKACGMQRMHRIRSRGKQSTVAHVVRDVRPFTPFFAGAVGCGSVCDSEWACHRRL